MKRTPADLIAAVKAAYRPDAPASVELMPGDHDAIAKLEQAETWLATVRRWLESDKDAARAFNAFRAREQGKGGDA